MIADCMFLYKKQTSYSDSCDFAELSWLTISDISFEGEGRAL